MLILAKRSTYVKAIYIYASETSCYVLSGNVIIYLMNGGSGPYKPYHFLKDCKKIFRSIYVNCFNILRFLAEVSTKLQKMHFFGQFKDCNSWRKHGNKTNDPIFSSTFSALLFQNQSPIFCCPLFSENYLNPQDRINKIVNKHTVDYHPIPSQLISRIQTIIFLWAPKGFISP